MMKKRRLARFILAAVLLVFAALGIGCAVYINDYYHAQDAAAAAMAGSGTVLVQQTEDFAVFSPEDPDAGFIFYPGGKVEYTAYAPLMLALAEQNVLCVLIQMPCNLAVLDMNAAEEIPEQFPEIENWYIGGHSLGGSMAASYAGSHADVLEGLVLLAAYSTEDLKETNLRVLSLYGSEDGVLNLEKLESYRSNLPRTALEQVIAGGNHAGFGSYGPQEGDGTAGISASEQIQIAADRIAGLLLGETA